MRLIFFFWAIFLSIYSFAQPIIISGFSGPIAKASWSYNRIYYLYGAPCEISNLKKDYPYKAEERKTDTKDIASLGCYAANKVDETVYYMATNDAGKASGAATIPFSKFDTSPQLVAGSGYINDVQNNGGADLTQAILQEWNSSEFAVISKKIPMVAKDATLQQLSDLSKPNKKEKIELEKYVEFRKRIGAQGDALILKNSWPAGLATDTVNNRINLRNKIEILTSDLYNGKINFGDFELLSI